MKLRKRHHLWTAGIATLVLLSFLAGTSLACFQKEAISTKMAEACCQGHCQHAMVGDVAAKCCQSHQTQASQALPTFPSAKAALSTATMSQISLVLPVTLQSSAQSCVHLAAEERPPPFPPLYALHCVLLI